MKKLLLGVLLAFSLGAGIAAAEEGTVEINGDYRFRYDFLKGQVHDHVLYDPNAIANGTGITVPNYPMAGASTTFNGRPVAGYSPTNDVLMTNRFGLNIRAVPLEDVSVKARLVMYKVFGHETMTPVQGSFFGDRALGPMDGTVGHVPMDNVLRVDYAYSTWSNVGGAPVWFSVGRRPSAGGIPGNIRQNGEKQGTAGIPNLLVDYAFDGMTVGYAPDIEILPGAYAKLCYGKGFDSGFNSSSNTNPIKDTDFLGVNVAAYDTEKLHVELQWQKGWNIFNAPGDGMNSRVDMGGGNFVTVNTPVSANLGDIEWIGGVVTSKLENLNLFFSAAQSKTKPNDNLFSLPFFSVNGGPVMNGGFGLLYDDCDPTTPGGQCQESRTGTAIYIGGRYDITSTGTKIGAEYNQGSKYWMGFVPAGDDMWTSKLGTRGKVYEVYVIQELPNKKLMKKGQAFVRLGYQLYKFDYTGSNSWIGAPKKISDLNTMDPSGTQMFSPLEEAKDIYLAFEVRF